MWKMNLIFLLAVILMLSCNEGSKNNRKEMALASEGTAPRLDSLHMPAIRKDSSISFKEPTGEERMKLTHEIDTRNISPEELMHFAETLVGVPYKYASTDPARGFDCSGFITYVFNHFNIKVPRSSIDFTNVGQPLKEEAVKRGDIILFTGTDPKETHVGHMGLVVSNKDSITFIHSTSGKAYSVTITPLNEYYRNRLVGFRRIFK